MPNWCSCDLFVHGSTKNRDLVVKTVEGNEDSCSVFDFNKILPMPSILENTVSPTDGLARSKQAFAETGHTDWYSWCRDNWGTKWNATGAGLIRMKTVDKFKFETAWAPPAPVILALSKLFPENTFTLKYYERGMQFKGIYRVKNGTIILAATSRYEGKRGG